MGSGSRGRLRQAAVAVGKGGGPGWLVGRQQARQIFSWRSSPANWAVRSVADAFDVNLVEPHIGSIEAGRYLSSVGTS